MFEANVEAPAVSCLIVDGAVLVQMLKPNTAKNFFEYATNIFIPHIHSQLRKFNVSRIDLVWDRYVEDSLKSLTRAKRGCGTRRRVVAGGQLPPNWQSFLRDDHNKTELFNFLSNTLLDSFAEQDIQLFVTIGDKVLSRPSVQENLESLSPCNHEEADTRMVLHVNHATHQGHQSIMIRTVDTDVVVLAVSVAKDIGEKIQLWLAFGTGKHFRYLPAHEIANGLGPQKTKALPMFHSLTGCDTVSSFVGHGKKMAWSAWNAMPELTNALLQLSSAPSDIEENVFKTVERFVILLYDRTSTCCDINKARRKLFAKRNNVKHIPPTKAAFEQHLRRAAYQGGHVWGQTLIPRPELPSPTEWGWIRTQDSMTYEPNWTSLPEASKVCYELLSCKCKKGCIKRCKCKKASLECTALCACERDCSQKTD